MQVFVVIPDVNHYQSLAVEDIGLWDSDRLIFDCVPKAIAWTPPSVYVPKPRLKRGHFFDLGPGSLVLDSFATEVLRELLEMSGELLPLFCKDEEFTVLNVLECFDLLDKRKTKWTLGRKTRKPIGIDRYAFCADHLPEVPLFKIPETSRSDILTVEGLKDPSDEFKHNVESNQLKGLLFEEIWTSDE